MIFELVVDRDGRLTERHSSFEHDKRPQSSFYMSRYQEYKDQSGESIWFPNFVDVHFQMGETANGHKVTCKRETLEVIKAEFNTNVPDSAFVLQFPPGAKVLDQVQGLGWVAGDDPAVRPEESNRNNRQMWWFLGINALIVAAIIAVLARRRLRKARAASS